ncbi:MAG: hypothetical protein JWO30_4591 [Fibrobacteres bacterium]|nr:hypothetical protein [Fibrobacterota bacterium]
MTYNSIFPSLLLFPALLCLTPCGAQTLNFDFESDLQGWTCDFADYPMADSVNWHLQYKVGAMPDITPSQNGVVMKGDNFSDDLFFFLKKRITGLAANTSYTVFYSIDVVTNSGPGSIGGSDLMLKAGATLIEPKKEIGSGGMYRMNIAKSNQSSPGPDMDTLGHVNHTDPASRKYLKTTFKNDKRPFSIKTDAKGEVWLIVGAESQFETPAEFLVAAITVTMTSPTGVISRFPAMGKPGSAKGGYGPVYDFSGRRVLNARMPCKGIVFFVR